MKRTRTLPSSLRLFGLILCGLLLSPYSYSQEVFTGPVLIIDGITYDQNTNEPVTGVVGEFYEFSSQLRTRENYIDGERDGLQESFYENGQLSGRGNFKDDRLDGLREEFDEDGNLFRTVTFKNGEQIEVNDNP